MDYKQFTIEDFILDESFQQFCLGVNHDAVRFWTDWLSKNENRRNEIEKARELYFLLNGNNDRESFKKHKAIFLKRLEAEGVIIPKEDAKVLPIGQLRKYTRSMFRFAAAAAILTALSTTIFFLFRKNDTGIADSSINKPTVNDVAPGGDRAVLTLADGRKIILETASNGTLARQGGSQVIKTGARLSYNDETNSKEVLYNTITTPKGGQYQLELGDGTKVWLNAASSLRFPTSFIAKERIVELTGEGYFEVAHNAAMPFHVKVNDMDVRVLGTKFNVNSYDDELNMKTTLLEGSVLVSSPNLKRAAALKPGQQAVLNTSELEVKNDNDMEVIMAWKNGKFNFNGDNIQFVMRQLERWYDVQIEYSGSVTKEEFVGIISRNVNLSEILKMLETTKAVEFEIKGRKIIVR